MPVPCERHKYVGNDEKPNRKQTFFHLLTEIFPPWDGQKKNQTKIKKQLKEIKIHNIGQIKILHQKMHKNRQRENNNAYFSVEKNQQQRENCEQIDTENKIKIPVGDTDFFALYKAGNIKIDTACTEQQNENQGKDKPQVSFGIILGIHFHYIKIKTSEKVFKSFYIFID